MKRSSPQMTLAFALTVCLLASAAARAQAPADAKTAAKDGHADSFPDRAVASLGTLRWRHNGLVTFAAFLPDGKRVLSVDDTNTVYVWEYPSGRELLRLGPKPGDAVSLDEVARKERLDDTSVAVSRDGTLVAVCFYGGSKVHMWEVATGKEIPGPTWRTAGRGRVGLAFVGDNERLAHESYLKNKGSVDVWDWSAAKHVRSFGPAWLPGFPVTRFLVSAPDGKTLAGPAGSEVNGRIRSTLHLWAPATGALQYTIINDGEEMKGTTISGVAFSGDGKMLAYSLPGGTITWVSVDSGKELGKVKTGLSAPALVFAADSKTLFARGRDDSAVHEWDLKTGKQLRQLGRSRIGPTARSFRDQKWWEPIPIGLSPKGKTLVMSSREHTSTFIDVASGKELDIISGHRLPVTLMQFSADGKELWTRAGDEVQTVGWPAAFWYPDGKDVAARPGDPVLRRWDAATSKQVAAVTLPPEGGRAILTPDGATLIVQISGKESAIAITETATGKVRAKIPTSPRDPFPDLTLSRDGKVLALRSSFPAHRVGSRWVTYETKVALYDMTTAKLRCAVPLQLARSPGIGPVGLPGLLVLSPDGSRVAAYSDPAHMGVWDTATGRKVGDISLKDEPGAFGGAFTPDGQALALDMNDGTVRLYEVASGNVRRSFGSAAPVPNGVEDLLEQIKAGAVPVPPAGVAISPDGKLLAHGDPKGVVSVWDAATAKAVTEFRGHKGAVLCLAFAPDGSRLASGGVDTTALVWQVAGLEKKAGYAACQLSQAEVQARWDFLAYSDSEKAFTAICGLSAASGQTVPFLAQRLRSAAALDSERVKTLIALVDDGKFEVREMATSELYQLGEQVLPALQKVVETKLPLQTKRRIEELRDRLMNPALSGERLRLVRAVEVLERIGSAESRVVLRTLADGAAGALETVTARAALARLPKQ
jgi:WD40 repeat protein